MVLMTRTIRPPRRQIQDTPKAGTSAPQLMGRVAGRPAPRSLLLVLARLDPRLELLHDVRVAEGRDVAQLAPLGDIAQQAAHDLARARLGQVVGPDDALGARELADAPGDVLADVVDQVVAAVEVPLERHEGR